MFFPALVFLAIRQAARLQALPYPLHDFAGAFLAAAPSFDRDIPHAGPPITAKVKKPTLHCTCGTGSSVRALGQFIEG
jgi:hypothetical protein